MEENNGSKEPVMPRQSKLSWPETSAAKIRVDTVEMEGSKHIGVL